MEEATNNRAQWLLEYPPSARISAVFHAEGKDQAKHFQLKSSWQHVLSDEVCDGRRLKVI
jgi:hypothetical protein